MKQKLKILTSAPLIIGVFLIIYAGFGTVYFQKQAECRDLDSQIVLKRMILQKPQPDIEKLQSRLEEAETKSEAALTSLPNPEQGIDIYGALIDLGHKGDVEILNIAASPPIAPKDGEGGRTTLPYSLSVQGSQNDILAFISSLIQGTDLLQGLELNSTSIQIGASSDDPDIIELELCIHTWPDPTSGEQEMPQTPGSEK